MSMFSEIQSFLSEPSWGITVGSVQDHEKVFVLKSVTDKSSWFFREWFYHPQERQPSFHFVSILSCARAFPDRALAEMFQRFLETNHHPVEIFQVERGRLIRPIQDAGAPAC
jgi:hypothetical protein